MVLIHSRAALAIVNQNSFNYSQCRVVASQEAHYIRVQRKKKAQQIPIILIKVHACTSISLCHCHPLCEHRCSVCVCAANIFALVNLGLFTTDDWTKLAPHSMSLPRHRRWPRVIKPPSHKYRPGMEQTHTSTHFWVKLRLLCQWAGGDAALYEGE